MASPRRIPNSLASMIVDGSKQRNDGTFLFVYFLLSFLSGKAYMIVPLTRGETGRGVDAAKFFEDTPRVYARESNSLMLYK